MEKIGKPFITSVTQLSASAYIQMVFQIALGSMGAESAVGTVGGFCLERVSTRLFRGGRYDYVRVVTPQTQAMVQVLLSAQASDAAKKQAFRQAADRHAQKAKDVMLGEGIDVQLNVLRFKSRCSSLSDTSIVPPVRLVSYNVGFFRATKGVALQRPWMG